MVEEAKSNEKIASLTRQAGEKSDALDRTYLRQIDVIRAKKDQIMSDKIKSGS